MGSNWVRTITTPFRKACTLINPPPRRGDNKSQMTEHDLQRIKLHGEVMACQYEDVQVLWSILDKSKSKPGACGELINSQY